MGYESFDCTMICTIVHPAGREDRVLALSWQKTAEVWSRRLGWEAWHLTEGTDRLGVHKTSTPINA